MSFYKVAIDDIDLNKMLALPFPKLFDDRSKYSSFKLDFENATLRFAICFSMKLLLY